MLNLPTMLEAVSLTLKALAKSLARLALIASALIPFSDAYADVGIRMLHIYCDTNSDYVKIEPFVLWNGETTFQGVTIQDPNQHKVQKIKNSYYYNTQNLNNKPLAMRCHLPMREVQISLLRKQLEIEDIAKTPTKLHSLDLGNEIGSAWDVYGPSAAIESHKLGDWTVCLQDQNKQSECKNF